MTVSRSLCRASRTVSLHNKNLTFFRIFGNAVCKFSVRVKAVLGLGKKVDLGSFLLFSNFCRLLRASEDGLYNFHISVKKTLELLSYNLGNLFRRL